MPSKRTIFVDRSLGGRVVAEALRAKGEDVVVHDQRFSPSASDDEWLEEVGRQDWIAITKDFSRGRSGLQRLAVAKWKARLFILRITGAMTASELANTFVSASDAMQSFANNNPPPFIAKVYSSGKVLHWKNRGVLLSELKTAMKHQETTTSRSEK